MSLDKKMEEIEKKAKKKKEDKNPYQEVFESSIAKASQAGIKELAKSLEKKQDQVIEKLDQILNSDQSTRRVEVKNTQDFPRQVDIKNWPDFSEVTVKNPQKEVEITNWPEEKAFPTDKLITGFGEKLGSLPEEFARQLKQVTQPVQVQNKNLEVFVLDPQTGKRVHPGGGSYAGVGGSGGTLISDIRDGDGDSVMDTANNAVRVNLVEGDISVSAVTEFDEDTAHTTGDAGIQTLAVRNDTLAALAGTDGDYAPFQVDADGALYVNVAAGSTAGTEFDEDTQHTTGDAGTQVLAVRNDTLAALAGTDGDYAPFQVDASGALYIQEGSALDVSAATVTVTDDGSFTLAANSGVDIGDVDVTSTVNNDNKTATGDVTANDEAVTVNAEGGANVGIQVTGTWSGTLNFEATVDGSNWVAVNTVSVNDWSWNYTITSNSLRQANVAGYDQFRVRGSSWSSGTATVTLHVSQGGAVTDFARVNLYSRGQTLADGASNAIDGLADEDNGGNIDIPTFPHVFNGTTWDRLRGDTSGIDISDISAGTQTNDVKVTLDGEAVTLSAIDNAVLDDIAANQTDATQKTQIVDGAGAVIGSTSNALDVNIASGSSSGTEYTEDAAAPANPEAPALSLVRDDVLSGQTTADGDIVTARGTDKGEIYVKHADDITIADGGNVITVDGTVTANLSATDNAVLDSIDSDTSAIKTAVEIIDNAVATEGSALGSGVLVQGDDGTDRTNVLVDTDGHLQVDVLSGGGSGTEYTEDEVTPNPIVGTATLIERDDALSAVTPVEGDWIGLRGTAEGALWVQDFNSDAILADTANIDTNVGTLAGAVSGSEMQVDVVAALPAGDNNIGNVDIASSVALDVSAATVTVDLGANNDVTIDDSSIVHAEDAVHGSGDAGVMSLAVRNDTLAALAGTDGDYSPLQVNASGALYVRDDDANTDLDTIAGAVSGSEMQVDVVASLPAGTNAIGKLAANSGVDIGDVDVTSVVPGTGASNLGKAEDAAHTTGDVGVMPLAVRNDTLVALAGTDGDYAPIQVNASGAVYIQEGSALDVSGATVTTTPAVTGGGTEASAQRVTIANDSTGVLSVDDNGGSLTIDGTVTANAGTGTMTVTDDGSFTLAANSGVDIGDVDVTSLPASTNTIEVVGDVAHDAAAAGNPNIVAGVAQDADDTAPPNRVSAEGDATRIATDFDGAVFTRPHGPQVWSYHLDTSTAQTDTQVHAAPGAGLSLYVTDIVFSSNDATAINLFFEEATTKVLGPYYLEAVAGRGMALHFSTPKKITANTALTLTTSASIAHSVDVTGYVAQG